MAHSDRIGAITGTHRKRLQDGTSIYTTLTSDGTVTIRHRRRVQYTGEGFAPSPRIHSLSLAVSDVWAFAEYATETGEVQGEYATFINRYSHLYPQRQ
jgi:hypothetical protein